MFHFLKQRPGFYKSAIMLMLPIIVQNLVTNTLRLADTFMVGALGETELAAVTMANTVFFILSLIIFGIQSGASVLVAQYNGRRNNDAINRVMGMGLYVSVTATSVLAVLTFLFPEAIMRAITTNESLIEPGSDYMRIVGFSYILMSFSGVYLAVQRSMENPKLGAIVLAFSGALNILLNYMFIFGNWGAPALGCAGAAWATLFSRAAEVTVVAIYASRAKNLPLSLRSILLPGRIIASDFIKFSIPVVVNECLWSVGISLYSIIIGHMDNSTPILAAYTISNNLDNILNIAMFAAGNATAVIIGRDLGRGLSKEEMLSEGLALNALCFGIGIINMGLIIFTRAYVCDSLIFPLLHTSHEAGVLAKFFLLISVAAMPMRSLNHCNIVGVFRGGGDVKYGLVADVLSLYAFSVPVSALAALVFGWSIYPVYIIMCTDEILKLFMCLPRLRSGKWINDVTRA